MPSFFTFFWIGQGFVIAPKSHAVIKSPRKRDRSALVWLERLFTSNERDCIFEKVSPRRWKYTARSVARIASSSVLITRLNSSYYNTHFELKLQLSVNIIKNKIFLRVSKYCSFSITCDKFARIWFPFELSIIRHWSKWWCSMVDVE